MWVVEDILLYWVFKDEFLFEGGGWVLCMVICYKSWMFVGKVMGYYLMVFVYWLGVLNWGENGVLMGVVDMFCVFGSMREYMDLVLWIGNWVFRIIEEKENEM